MGKSYSATSTFKCWGSTAAVLVIFSLLYSNYVVDLISNWKKLELHLMVVSVLLKAKFTHTQISVPKISILMSKTALSSPRVICTLKMLVLFDMKSGTCFLLLVVIVWKCEYFLNFLVKCFITACFRFSYMYFLTIRMALINKEFRVYLIFLKLFTATLPYLISSWKELNSSMIEFCWFS